ncbi:CU044_2847 family protein [Streptomyces clavuligerus]|nr:CU044_2847 family protein [Streptomyces clavuligerus]MBY6307378.1 hypothetical protein [Streptomyces clavuligerus]QCS10059.1 hypothetical protein CRV15_31260 [Streptomyces clavuligerus]QPJ97897.1 hypothetical protein GE265_33190 [Streptomyces clavuligerus]WDN56765.1 hypothetical protein LL058_33685 [Streptomyces clavuligerus]
MGDVTLIFDDGSTVRLHLAPETDTASGAGNGSGSGRGGGTAHPEADGTAGTAGTADELDLPEGFGSARPVSVDGRAAQALTRSGDALAQALRPLGGVLDGIHRSFTGFAQRPDEVTVQFGVTLGSDLSLGVFSGSGQASFTVSATWNLANGTPPGNRPGERPPPPPRANGS